MSYADSVCFWSPTGDHLLQLERLDLGRGRSTLVDKCRHCGALAFQPIALDAPRAPAPYF